MKGMSPFHSNINYGFFPVNVGAIITPEKRNFRSTHILLAARENPNCFPPHHSCSRPSMMKISLFPGWIFNDWRESNNGHVCIVKRTGRAYCRPGNVNFGVFVACICVYWGLSTPPFSFFVQTVTPISFKICCLCLTYWVFRQLTLSCLSHSHKWRECI